MGFHKPALALLIALLVSAGGHAAFPGRAAAARTPCWERVIDDWLDNGTIDGRYPTRCYQAALKHVPEDLRDYTDIADSISLALQASLRPSAVAGTVPTGHTQARSKGSAATHPGTKHLQLSEVRDVPKRSPYRRGVDYLGGTSAEAVPIPLLVLGGVGGALLLSAACLAAVKRRKPRR